MKKEDRQVSNENNSENGIDMNVALPLWEKPILTIKETALLFHIGINRVRQISKESTDQGFVVKIGNHTLIKRKMFEEYIYQKSEL